MLDELRVTSCQTWHPWWSDRSAMTSSDCPAGGSRGIDGAAVAAAAVVSSAPALVRTAPVTPWVQIAMASDLAAVRRMSILCTVMYQAASSNDTTGLVRE